MTSRDKSDAPDRESIAQLVLALAHDCGNLLAIAELGARNAARDLPRGTRAHGDLQIVRDVIDRMGVMMQRIRAFSRAHEVVPEPLNLNDLARYVSSILAPLFGGRAVLRLNFEPALPPIEADRLEMEQVLMNLLLNAREATAPQGHIDVETRVVVIDNTDAGNKAALATGVYAQLTVSDNGRGMTEATLAQVFDPFFTTKSVGAGTGLGLAGSRRIIERSGGSILIESDARQGTRVKVLLPARTAGALGQPRRAPGARPQPQATGASVSRSRAG
jgi:two-component system cell cycle sensor histidine kinase/response regulator CckA